MYVCALVCMWFCLPPPPLYRKRNECTLYFVCACWSRCCLCVITFLFVRVKRHLGGIQSRPVAPCHTSSNASPFSSHTAPLQQSLLSSTSSILEHAYPWMPRAHPHIRSSDFTQQRRAACRSLDEGLSLFSREVWKRNLGTPFWNKSCHFLISKTRLPYSRASSEVWSAAAYLLAQFLYSRSNACA